MTATVASVDGLENAFDALHRALEGRDAAAILSATRDIRAAVDELRSARGGTLDTELRARLEVLLPEIDTARVKVNQASDTVRQRMERLAQRGVETAAPLTYGR